MITMPDCASIGVNACQANRQADPQTQDAIAALTSAAKEHFIEQLVLDALCSRWGRIRA